MALNCCQIHFLACEVNMKDCLCKNGTLCSLVDIPCLSEQGYDDFLSETRSCFKEAKAEWDSKLEVSFQRMHQHENETNTNTFISQLTQYRPFRDLLYLYASIRQNILMLHIY